MAGSIRRESSRQLLLHATKTIPDDLGKFRDEMEKKLDQQKKDSDFEKDNQFKQIDNLMKRLYLLENKY